MRISLIALFIFFQISGFAQDYLDEIAQEACDCIEGSDLSVSKKDRNMQLGVCMIEAATPYKKELKKNHKIDLSNLSSKDGRKLGELIGLRLAGICPQMILELDKSEKELAEDRASLSTELTIDVVVKDITNGQFYTLTVSDEDSRQYNLFWLFPFENSYDLLKGKDQLVGQNAKITYEDIELFDPKINEYRKFKVIRKITWK